MTKNLFQTMEITLFSAAIFSGMFQVDRPNSGLRGR